MNKEANLLKTLLILPKTKNLNWLHHVTLKTNLSNTHLEKSVETNFFKKFKVIASLLILTPYLRIFSKKKGFSENVVNPDNLVLTTSTAQVELSKLNLNFDDIRTYFLQVLRDCWQITFVTPDGFCLLSNKNPTPLFLTDNIKTDRILSKIFYIVFQVLKVLLIKICKIQSLDLLFLVVFISFYISRYHFSQVFRTSFNIIWKKIFLTIFHCFAFARYN